MTLGGHPKRIPRPTREISVVAGCVTLALLLRLVGLRTAHDVFVDEATYARLGESVASGHFVPVLFGRYFYLHPPMFFWLLGAMEAIGGPKSDLVTLVMELRVINVVFAGVTTALIFGIGRRLGGSRVGTVSAGLAALLFAADPFLVEYDSLVLLETSATTFALLGWWLFLRQMNESGELPASDAVLAGICFGVALLTKETTFFLFGPALGLAVLINRPVLRSRAALALVAAAIVYVGTFIALIAAGSWSEFTSQKLEALRRLSGTVKTTGFKAPGAPSFISKTLADLPHYGATYLLMGLGAVTVLYLLWRGTARRRLFALAVGGELLALAFNFTVGGLVEQQHFYLYVAPATIVVALAAADALSSDSRQIQGAVAVGLALLLVLDGAHFVVNRIASDNGYVQLDQYLRANYGEQTLVLSTTDAWELLSATPLEVERGTPLTQQATATRLVLTSTTQINEGYASVGREIYVELRSDGARVIWSYHGRSNGTLELWLLPTP